MAETAADYEASKQVRTRSWYKLPRPIPLVRSSVSQILHIPHTPQLLKLCHELESNYSKHELMENILERNHNSEYIAIIAFLFFIYLFFLLFSG